MKIAVKLETVYEKLLELCRLKAIKFTEIQLKQYCEMNVKRLPPNQKDINVSTVRRWADIYNRMFNGNQ